MRANVVALLVLTTGCTRLLGSHAVTVLATVQDVPAGTHIVATIAPGEVSSSFRETQSMARTASSSVKAKPSRTSRQLTKSPSKRVAERTSETSTYAASWATTCSWVWASSCSSAAWPPQSSAVTNATPLRHQSVVVSMTSCGGPAASRLHSAARQRRLRAARWSWHMGRTVRSPSRRAVSPVVSRSRFDFARAHAWLHSSSARTFALPASASSERSAARTAP